jgi:hypothetical protein
VKFKLTNVILHTDGKPLIETETEDGKRVETPLTYRAIFHQALNVVVRDQALGTEQKVRMYRLDQKLFSASEVELTKAECVLLLERIDKVYPGPFLYSHVKDLLDPEPKEQTAKS